VSLLLLPSFAVAGAPSLAGVPAVSGNTAVVGVPSQKAKVFIVDCPTYAYIPTCTQKKTPN